jgi:hypothetical protein
MEEQFFVMYFLLLNKKAGLNLSRLFYLKEELINSVSPCAHQAFYLFCNNLLPKHSRI